MLRINKMASKGPSRHHLDLSGVVGCALDPEENQKVYKSVAKDVGVLKGLNGKLTTIPLRTLANQIYLNIKNVKRDTPLAAGNVLIEFTSKEGLIKGVSLPTFNIGNIRCRITGMPEETTYDVVIHGIPLEEDLACLQETLEYDRSKGVALIRVVCLKSKTGARSMAIKLTLLSTCPLRVFVRKEGAALEFKIETYVKLYMIASCPILTFIQL